MNRMDQHARFAAILLLMIGGLFAHAQESFDRAAFFAVPDFAALPPAIEVVSEKTEDGVTITEMYMAGAPFNGEQTKIYGFYCRPEKPGKYPAVLEIHGAGTSGSQVSSKAGIYYAQHGYACFVMDWAGPSEKRQQEGWRHSELKVAGNMARNMKDKEAYPPHGWKTFGREVDGIRNGVLFARRVAMFLRSRPEVNPEQICVSGMSAGAHLTLLLLGVEPAFRAAAVKYGTGFIDDITFGGYFGPVLMTNRTEQEDWLAALDPKHGLRDYRASTLILSGTNDIFFWMPAVLQTYRAAPTDKRLIMRPNDNHSQVGNTEIPLAWFNSILGTDPAWPTIAPPTASIAEGKLTLRVQPASTPGIERVDYVVKRQPAKDFYWNRRNEPERSADWTVQPATLDGDTWAVTIPAVADGEQLVVYATAYDTLGREVSSDTVELPDYPFWRGQTYEPWEKIFKATAFQRAELADPARLRDVQANGNLAGVKKGEKGQRPAIGAFEYDFWTPFSGWYELIVPGGNSLEYTVDGQYAYGSDREGKVGNFYLEKTRHTIRLQRYFWTGLPTVESFTLRAIAPDDLAGHLRVTMTENRNVRRMGEAIRLRVQSGRLPKPATLTAELVIGGKIASTAAVELCDWPSDEVRIVPLPCAWAGEGFLRFLLNGQEVSAGNIHPIRVSIVDTTYQAPDGGELQRTLLTEIDCATTEPDYSKGGTRVIEKPFGAYRESGSVGWLSHMNSTDPTWFAYTFTVPEVQVPYVIEVEAPDDALRTFCIAVREGVPGAYPSTVGVDSGGEWPLSHAMITRTIVYWPRSTDLRLAVIPALDGRRAAISRIRIYKVEGELPLLSSPRTGGRHFANWYEEGSNFKAVFGGAKNGGPSAPNDLELADRWARTMRYMGGDTLWMTMVVYQFGLYPSRYNTNFGGPYSDDLVGKVILSCERYGMDFIGEFHPEARELDWPINADPARMHEAVNRNGEFRSKTTEPRYNPIWPANREWYLGMIGEFVDRYAESPALRGVCLRTMGWANPGLSNFHSLDWGYDDYTIGRFVADTGTEIPVDAGSVTRFRQRYDWLLSNAREAWIAWRCEQIAELYRQAVARVRQARPDLIVMTGIEIGGDPREAGLDPKLLGAIDGLVLRGGGTYGRRQGNELAVQELRDQLLDPAFMHRVMPGKDQRAAYRHGSGYFEATGDVMIPQDLGFQADTPRTWMSGVVEPAGRHALERWAITLAETDTSFLADGGNAYTIGQPILREFLADYRNLPAAPFTPRADARDPVAVWSRQHPADQSDRFYFYAVSRERYPTTVTIALKGAATVTRLADGSTQSVDGGKLVLELQPYEVRAFQAQAGTTIESVTTEVPQAARDHAAALVEFLEKTAEAARKEELGVPLRSEDVKLLTDRAREARQALEANHLWRARTMIEHHDLRRIYDRLKRYPPDLRDTGNPVAPEGAMLPQQLLDRVRQGNASLAPSSDIVPNWVGTELLVSTDESLEFTISMPVDALNGLEFGRVAGGDYGDIELSVDGQVVGVLRDTGAQRGIVSWLAGAALMRQGETKLRLRRLTGTAMAVNYIRVSPVYTDITADRWLAAGPFMVGDLKALGKRVYEATTEAMKTPAWQAVETTRDLNAAVALPDGGTSRWQPLASTGDFMDFGQTFDRTLGCISYAVTHIQTPRDARVRLSYGMDYWMKIWLNGDLVQDVAPHGGAPFKGQFSLDVPLRKGVNELLVKVASGSLGNGFWMAVSDPGNLTFSPRP